MLGRRGFITGLVSLVAAPAIVRAGSLMPVRTMPVALTGWTASAAYEAGDIIKCEDLFLRGLFKILSDHPDMTASQILPLVVK